jgi:hypothetical protein
VKEDAVMLRMLRIAALAGLCLAALANAGDEPKYTGQIVGIESGEGMIPLEEIGPWTGQFVEAPLTAADLSRGDDVTVATALQRGRLVARSIAVIRPAAP